jgi:hypothetical protein
MTAKLFTQARLDEAVAGACQHIENEVRRVMEHSPKYDRNLIVGVVRSATQADAQAALLQRDQFMMETILKELTEEIARKIHMAPVDGDAVLRIIQEKVKTIAMPSASELSPLDNAATFTAYGPNGPFELPKPTYYVGHPKGSFAVAEPQPIEEAALWRRDAEVEAPWRKLLWFNHARYLPNEHTPYGDDGEMQCCGIDFKRMNAKEIDELLVRRSLERIAALRKDADK